jgi:hypothetical protein
MCTFSLYAGELVLYNYIGAFYYATVSNKFVYSSVLSSNMYMYMHGACTYLLLLLLLTTSEMFLIDQFY